MATLTEQLNSRVALVIGGATLIGFLFGSIAWLDSRHASAADIDDLTRLLKQSEISRIEYQIEEIDRRRRRILMIPPVERDRFDNADLEDMEARKEALLRQLERLEGRD